MDGPNDEKITPDNNGRKCQIGHERLPEWYWPTVHLLLIEPLSESSSLDVIHMQAKLGSAPENIFR